MTIKHGQLPEGFQVLSVTPKLLYKEEADGGLIITGEPKKTFFNLKLTSGATISGGIKMNGDSPILYGDYNNNNKRYPLRWVQEGDIANLPPPNERRNKPGTHPWKEHMSSKEEDENYVSKYVYDEIKKERDSLLSKLARVETQIAQVKDQATKEVQGLREEFHKKVKVRSVHLESTLTRSSQIEGHKTEHWEVGDRKYLVIAETPSGLGAGSWVEDITAALNKVTTGQDVTVAVVPSGASVRVVEMIPVSDVADNLETGQF
jgi:hypothetical protein